MASPLRRITYNNGLLTTPHLKEVKRKGGKPLDGGIGKGVYIQSLSKDVQDFITSKRGRDYIRDISKSNFEKFKYTKYLRQGLAFGFLTAIVHERCMEVVRRSIKNPLRGLSCTQVDILIMAWTFKQIKQSAFNKDQLIQRSVKEYRYNHVNLVKLVKLGYIEVLSTKQLFLLTKKCSTKDTYYRISKAGSHALKQYFIIYNNAHHEFTGEFWRDTLEELSPFEHGRSRKGGIYALKYSLHNKFFW